MQSVLDLLAGRGGEIGLDRAALELARIEDPELVIEPFLGILDSYAVELSGRLGESAGGADYVACANEYLFGELGFKGNADDYYDPRNSCLNHVLTARTGIPISLAAVYLEIARRLARPVFGIGLPGHFLVQYRAEDFTAYIDVFRGGACSRPTNATRRPGNPRASRWPPMRVCSRPLVTGRSWRACCAISKPLICIAERMRKRCGRWMC